MKIDELIRSKRKTVGLYVDFDGRLVVRAPQRLPRRVIEAFVKEREDWIVEQQEKARLLNRRVRPKRYVEGELFSYLGVEYPLVFVDRQRPVLLLDERFELSRSAQPEAERVFIDWYRARAREVITERVKILAETHGYRYQGIRITSARTRWGSCNTRGGLNFTYRLVMTPPEIIDYVVLHELAHTRVSDHSPRFWSQVAENMPDYKSRVRWLKDNGLFYRHP